MNPRTLGVLGKCFFFYHMLHPQHDFERLLILLFLDP